MNANQLRAASDAEVSISTASESGPDNTQAHYGAERLHQQHRGTVDWSPYSTVDVGIAAGQFASESGNDAAANASVDAHPSCDVRLDPSLPEENEPFPYTSPAVANRELLEPSYTLSSTGTNIYSAPQNYAPSRQPNAPPAINHLRHEDIWRQSHQFEWWQNRYTGAQTVFQNGPAEDITDPALLRQGIPARRMVHGDPPEAFSAPQDTNPAPPPENEAAVAHVKRLFAAYKVRKDGRKFFVRGRVFLTLWAEPAGANSDITSPHSIEGLYGERIYQKIRRFVVVREGNNFCTALPVSSYGEQGVPKVGTIKSEHAIIYIGKEPPEPQQKEAPRRGEPAMRTEKFRVLPDINTETLHPMSRLDFGKPTTVQHNVKVKNLGLLDDRSKVDLYAVFLSVQGKGGPGGRVSE